MSKVNPRRQPRSEADVRKAYQRGKDEGVSGALAIMVLTLKDLGEPDAFISKFEHKFNKTVASLAANDVKQREITGSLKEDYDIEIECK